jgi:prephenate dehydrogenase
VKGSVVKELETLIAKAGAHFVGSHPMAGSEKTGVSAARADLFECAVCVTTPTKRTNAAALRKVEQFWKAIGCRMLRLTPEVHDKLVSRSSHLPQLVAALLAHEVLDPRAPREQAMLCAGGFRDTTRIASGSPEMWRDIALANRSEIGKALGQFIRELEGVRLLLQRGDAKKIHQLLTTAKTRRDVWLAGCISPSPE